jgi:hypothetical protein
LVISGIFIAGIVFMSVILATPEVEIRRIIVQGQSGKKFTKTPSQ